MMNKGKYRGWENGVRRLIKPRRNCKVREECWQANESGIDGDINQTVGARDGKKGALFGINER